jgi:hypothetical protein
MLEGFVDAVIWPMDAKFWKVDLVNGRNIGRLVPSDHGAAVRLEPHGDLLKGVAKHHSSLQGAMAAIAKQLHGTCTMGVS